MSDQQGQKPHLYQHPCVGLEKKGGMVAQGRYSPASATLHPRWGIGTLWLPPRPGPESELGKVHAEKQVRDKDRRRHRRVVV